MYVNRHIVGAIFIHLDVAVLPWYITICIVLQNDKCRHFITVFNNSHTLWD